MSYNPNRDKHKKNNHRAKRESVVYKNLGRRKSEVARRQSLGVTVPTEGRTRAPHGLTAEVFAGKKFTIKADAIGAGNSLGYGVNASKDRVIYVTSGKIFVTVLDPVDTTQRQVVDVPAGRFFKAPAGTPHGLSAPGTMDAEILLIEEKNYAKTWDVTEAAVTSELAEVFMTGPEEPKVVGSVRRDSSKSREVQAQLAKAQTKSRRKPKKLSANPDAQPTASVTNNANSGNVKGVNPMPSFGK